MSFVFDLASHFAVAGILITSAFISTFFPLRRALRIDPAVTLKQD